MNGCEALADSIGRSDTEKGFSLLICPDGSNGFNQADSIVDLLLSIVKQPFGTLLDTYEYSGRITVLIPDDLSTID